MRIESNKSGRDFLFVSLTEDYGKMESFLDDLDIDESSDRVFFKGNTIGFSKNGDFDYSILFKSWIYPFKSSEETLFENPGFLTHILRSVSLKQSTALSLPADIKTKITDRLSNLPDDYIIKGLSLSNLLHKQDLSAEMTIIELK